MNRLLTHGYLLALNLGADSVGSQQSVLVLGCGTEDLFATYIEAQDQDTLYTHFGVQEPVYHVQGRGVGGEGGVSRNLS